MRVFWCWHLLLLVIPRSPSSAAAPPPPPLRVAIPIWCSSPQNMAASPAAVAGGGSLRCVVVAVDGSEESMNALRWALDNLRLDGQVEGAEEQQPGALHVLHVQSPPSIAAGLNPGGIPFGGPSHVEVPAFTAAIEAHQRRISEAIISHAIQICSEKHVNAKSQVVVGDPKELLCEVTANLHADLLVMGCRAFGAIKRMFLGSVSNYCINHVQCPVVVIKDTQQV